jgi:hypothetical protein
MLSKNLEILTSWKPLGQSMPVTGLLYLYLYITTDYILNLASVENKFTFIRHNKNVFRKSRKCAKYVI